MNQQQLKKLSKQVRFDIIDMLDFGGRGHVVSALSIVEILIILYHGVMKHNPKNPSDLNRDRFILSKGHGCMALYSVLARLGYFSTNEFRSFCKIDGMLGGHPSRIKVPGIELSTGSLGQGLSVAIGMALNAQVKKLNHHIYCLLGDGECNEGSIWEAALSASKHSLNNLTVLIDCNQYQSYGMTAEVCPLDPLASKWESFGFHVDEVNIRETPLQLKESLSEKIKDGPRLIICHTIKGMGIPLLEGNLSWHHKLRPSPEELQNIRRSLQ